MFFKKAPCTKERFIDRSHKECMVSFRVGIYLFKVNFGNTRKMCEMRSKLTMTTPERRHWRRTDVFIVNLEQISHIFVFPIFTLNK